MLLGHGQGWPVIESEYITVRYAGKRGPRGSHQKVTKVQVVDAEFLMKGEIEFQGDEREVEKNAEAKAAKE